MSHRDACDIDADSSIDRGDDRAFVRQPNSTFWARRTDERSTFFDWDRSAPYFVTIGERVPSMFQLGSKAHTSPPFSTTVHVISDEVSTGIGSLSVPSSSPSVTASSHTSNGSSIGVLGVATKNMA